MGLCNGVEGQRLTRARVDIGRGGVAVENAWLRREWRDVPPETVSLVRTGGAHDWCAAAGPDFALVMDGERVTPAQCEDASWSEDVCSAGAVLQARVTLPGLQVQLRHVVYHAFPAIQRFLTVMSLRDEAIELSLAEADGFVTHAEGAEVRIEGFRLAHTSLDLVSSEPGVALTHGREGLVVGADGGAHYRIFPEDAAWCAVSPEWSGVVEPYETAHLGSSYVFVFEGNPTGIMRGDYADFLAQLRKERKNYQKNGMYPYEY